MTRKDTRIEIRLTSKERAKIVKAAKKAKLTLSNYVLSKVFNKEVS